MKAFTDIAGAMRVDRWLTTDVLGLQMSMPLAEEIGIGLAILLTFLGMVLHWRLPHRQMAVEELVKDGKITPGEADRQMRFHRFLAPLTAFAGIGMLLCVLVNFID